MFSQPFFARAVRPVTRSSGAVRLALRSSLLPLSILLASCGAGSANSRELAATDSILRATEVSMASNSASNNAANNAASDAVNNASDNAVNSASNNASNSATSAQSIEGPMWRLIDYAGAQGARSTPSSRTAIRLTNGSMNGTGGCNRIGARYTINGEQLRFGTTNSSMRACMDDVNAHERAFLALLETVRTYAIAGGRLTLRSSGGDPVLVFAPEVEKPIFGRAWVIQNYNTGRGGVSTVLVGSNLTMTLAADGTVSGNAGCNTFSSSYSASGTSLTFTPAAATKKMCNEPAGLMQQESAIFAALSEVVSYYVEDDTLQLRGADGEIRLLLRPAEAP